MKKRNWILAVALLLPAALMLLFRVLKDNGPAMERWVFGVTAPVEQFLGRMWAVIPVSGAEPLTALVLAGAAAWLIWTVVRLIRDRSPGGFLRRLLVLLAVLLGFLFTALPGPAVIRFLKRMDFRQTERREGPQSHLDKNGTPTMGGVFLLLGWLLAALIGVREGFSLVLPVLLVMVLCGLMGFLDDFIKISTGTSMGLLPYQKVLLQFVISLLAAIWLYRSEAVGSAITLPFSGKSWDMGGFYIPFALFVLMGTMNGVNLTDGLDGLASSVTALVSLFMALMAQGLSIGDSAVFYTALSGACVGFLVYNHYPAKVFMGDTGSMALGSAIAACAVMMKMEFILAIAGFIYIMESGSVIIQVAYFKKTHGKRIFRMSPIHHHFELGGMHETKVVRMFVTLTLIFCLIAFGVSLI